MKRFVMFILLMVIIFTMPTLALADKNIPIEKLYLGEWLDYCATQPPKELIIYPVDNYTTIGLRNLPNINTKEIYIDKNKVDIVKNTILGTILYITVRNKALYVTEYLDVNTNNYIYVFDKYTITLSLIKDTFICISVKKK